MVLLEEVLAIIMVKDILLMVEKNTSFHKVVFHNIKTVNYTDTLAQLLMEQLMVELLNIKMDN